MLVHCEAVIAILEADVTLPYVSMVTLDTFDPDPYIPAITPLGGNIPVGNVPVIFEAVMLARPEPFPLMNEDVMEFKFEIPETLSEVRTPTEVILG